MIHDGLVSQCVHLLDRVCDSSKKSHGIFKFSFHTERWIIHITLLHGPWAEKILQPYIHVISKFCVSIRLYLHVILKKDVQQPIFSN